jgi:hypothetical protein
MDRFSQNKHSYELLLKTMYADHRMVYNDTLRFYQRYVVILARHKTDQGF